MGEIDDNRKGLYPQKIVNDANTIGYELIVPVIKFRKGGIGHSGGAPAAAAPTAAAPAAAPAAPQSQPAASMSTGAIPDIDLPLRYRRQPLSDEEIDHINGGGIV